MRLDVAPCAAPRVGAQEGPQLVADEEQEVAVQAAR
jgi:hypothetical protein